MSEAVPRRRVVAAPGTEKEKESKATKDGLEDDDEGTAYEPPENMPEGTIFFRYNKFQHNARVAVFMLPTIAVLCTFGGKTTMATVVAGVLVTYMLDFYGWKEGTFISIWVTAICSMVTLFMASLHLFTVSIFNVALVYNMIAFCASAGLWGTLQFTDLQRQHPRTVLVMERLLFALMPSTPPVILTWACIAVNGAYASPYYLAVFLAATFVLYVLPARSSFRVLGKGRSRKVGPFMEEQDELIMGRFETSVHCMCFTVLPAMLKTAVHHGHLYNSHDDLADVMLLHFVPPLIILSLTNHGSLWWLGLGLNDVKKTSTLLGSICLLLVVGALEVRVIFHSFRQYIKLLYPWDYVVITAGVYSIAFIVVAHFTGMLAWRGANVVLSLLGAASLVSIEIALGMPWYMLPFGAAGGYLCTNFYYHRRLMDYLCFVATASMVLFWFIARSFMFLDFEFDPLPMSLRHVCIVLMAVVLSSLLLPGLVAAGKRKDINGGVLVVHAVGVCVIELQLHCQFKGIYPGYLVALTSCLGLFLAHLMWGRDKVARTAAWLMASIYFSKLGLLLHPTPFALPSSLLLVLSITPIYLGWAILPPPASKSAVAGLSRRQMQAASPVTAPMSKLSAMGLMCVSAASLLLTRHTVIASLLTMTVHSAPPESFLIGACAVIWTFANWGLASHHFPQSAKLRRAFALCLCIGATLILIEPDMGFATRFSPVSFPGSPPTRRKATWPSWCLFASVTGAMLLVAPSVKKIRSLHVTIAWSAGFLAGLYFEGNFLPPSVYLWAIAGTACGLAAVFATSLHSITSRNALFFQGVFTIFVGILPVTYLLQPSLLRGIRANLRSEAIAVHRVGLLGLYSAVCTVLAVVIKYSVSARERKFSTSSSRPQVGGLGRSKLQASVAAAQSELHWVASVGNVCAGMAFGLAVHINSAYLGGSDSAVFCLVPLLLLLSRDNGLLAQLTDAKRYFPLAAVSVGYLALSALFQLLLRDFLEKRHLIPKTQGYREETASLLAVLRNLASLVVTMPGHYMFASFMWNFKHTRDIYWVLLLPLNFLPIMLSDLPSVRLLGALGLAAGGIQLFLSNRIRRYGMQFV